MGKYFKIVLPETTEPVDGVSENAQALWSKFSRKLIMCKSIITAATLDSDFQNLNKYK